MPQVSTAVANWIATRNRPDKFRAKFRAVRYAAIITAWEILKKLNGEWITSWEIAEALGFKPEKGNASSRRTRRLLIDLAATGLVEIEAKHGSYVVARMKPGAKP